MSKFKPSAKFVSFAIKISYGILLQRKHFDEFTEEYCTFDVFLLFLLFS